MDGNDNFDVNADDVMLKPTIQMSLEEKSRPRELEQRRPIALQVNNSQTTDTFPASCKPAMPPKSDQKKGKPLRLEDFLTTTSVLPAPSSSTLATSKPVTHKHVISQGKGPAALQKRGEPADDLIRYVCLRLKTCKNLNTIIGSIVENPKIITAEFSDYINDKNEDGVTYKSIHDELKDAYKKLPDTDQRKAKLAEHLGGASLNHRRR